MQVKLVGTDDPSYSAVKTMVHDVFALEYGADVNHLPSQVLAVFDQHNQPLGAAGLRSHDSGFFSECYLKHSVEEEIARKTGTDPKRQEILELTSLASVRPGAMALLLRGFAYHGLNSGFRWGIFTATNRLRNMALRLGMKLTALAPAKPEAVKDAAAWGRYYDYHPLVCAVDGYTAHPFLNSRLLFSCQDGEQRLPTTTSAALKLSEQRLAS